jgi:tetratricopeptide (TPR) repeat protein
MSRIAVVCAALALLCVAVNPVAAHALTVSSRADGEALIAAAPREARNYLACADWLEAQGDLHESAAVLEAGCRAADAPAPVLLQLAGVQQRLGKLARAEAVAREALVLLPDLPEAHVRMGDIYLALGWPQSALESYEAAVRLGPGQTLPRVRLVAGLLEAGTIPAAEDRCLEYIAETPDDPQLWLALGQVFEKQDKLREAFTTYGQVLGLDPASAEAYARQGRLFCRFGQYSPAADACRKALQLDEGNLVAHAYLGIACSYLGDGEQARHHAQIAEAGGLNMTAVWKKLN